MNLTVGSRVGPYEITGRIGAGGMGEVLRARDTRIGRDVAIKVLPEEVASDPDRLRRFEQEARAAGTLNHPNLVTIHDLGTHEGAPYLVMELLEGETLREKLGDHGKAARLPIRKAMDYATQLANGLAAAHEKGIIHRDLKPDNVFVTKDGRLKLLDFGLAKVADRNASDDPAAATRARDTAPGTVLGTAGYMSPEQVRGQDTDQRTDIFAAGAIFYEMVSGQRAFHGPSGADTMSAILNQDPPELDSSSGQHVSPVIDRVIRRCLEKERTQRFESARDLAFALEAVTSSSTSREVATADEESRSASRRWVWALPALLVVAAVAAYGAFRAGRASVKPFRATFTQLTTDAGLESAASIAPDGKTFVFVKGSSPNRQIFLQRVDGRSAIALSRSAADDDRAPAFSPDGSRIAFRSSRDGGGIFVMGATGESVRRIASEGFDPCWSPDGREIILAAEEMIAPNSRNTISHLSIVNVETGALRAFSTQDAMQPQFSPNGKRVAYWALKARSGQRDLYTISTSGEEKTIVPLMDDVALDWNPVWAPDGKSIFFSSDRGGTMNLWRIDVDEETGAPRGAPRPLAVPASSAGQLTVSRDGRQVIYASRSMTMMLRRGTLDPVSERLAVEEQPILAGTLQIRTYEASPDGQWVAFSTDGREDIYVIRADGSELRQLTNDDVRDRGVAWTADSANILFYSERAGTYDAWSVRLDGSGLTQLTSGLKVNFPIASRDGTRLAFHDLSSAFVSKIGPSPATTAEPLPRLPNGDLFFPTGWSPDGTRLAGTGWKRRNVLWIYSFAERRYTPIARGPGDDPDLEKGLATWVDDQRLLSISMNGQLLLDDLQKKSTRVLGTADTATISSNGRTVVLRDRRLDLDLWMATLDANSEEGIEN
jgi:serine/threonine protein kinase/Tol biopolymer transport system component